MGEWALGCVDGPVRTAAGVGLAGRDPGTAPGGALAAGARTAAASEPRQAPPVPVAGDASGWSMDERLYNQVWGMFEDLARTAAAYRSACDFAESRLDRELDQSLSNRWENLEPVLPLVRG
ncbi:hypothetical protein R6L23_18815 [Streptomyces sp. SR27]|uniref:hypothetical protein n=1 Tax=Streptomyces sp. SR27 TaxID=3076630 RepID=UPI00295C258C|nr:hypothetical protein [Streptomyces sp. SR27]MDV9190237.1 hypothetical protein [Streptomyces sp. SR27]